MDNRFCHTTADCETSSVSTGMKQWFSFRNIFPVHAFGIKHGRAL